MEIKIIEFFPDDRGLKKGTVDFMISHTHEKSETFRNIGFFQKENRSWLNIPAFKRNEEWFPVYDRPGLKELLKDVLSEVHKYLEQY